MQVLFHFYVVGLTQAPCLCWQKHTDAEWPITSNDLIVLLSSFGTCYMGHMFGKVEFEGMWELAHLFLIILPIFISGVTSKP